MKHESVMALTNEVERSIPVAQWRVHGVQLWPIIRSRLIRAAFDESVGSGSARGGRLQGLRRRAAAALPTVTGVTRDLPRGRLLRSPADAIIVTDGVAVTRIDGAAYDVVGDPLLNLLQEAGATASTWYTTYSCPQDRKTAGVLIQWRLDSAQLRLLCRTRSSDEPPGYREFLDRIQRAGLPQQAMMFARMSFLAARVAVMAERFEGWLEQVAPRLVFVNCYYSLEGAALMLACRRRRILSVDVQHGVQGDQHVAYGSWVNVPAAGYEVLPDRFWCWSEHETRAIRAWAEEARTPHQALVGGNPWMEMWLEDRAPFVRGADEALRALVRPKALTVLVTLQWGMTDQVFLDPLIELIAQGGPSWTWWVRLHPAMRARREDIRARLSAGKYDNIRLDEPSDFALPALLKRSDVHLTHSSSTVLEAAALGVPSVITISSGGAYFPDLVQEGMALVASTSQPQDVLSALSRIAPRRRPISSGKHGQGASAIRQLLADARPHSEKTLGA